MPPGGQFSHAVDTGVVCCCGDEGAHLVSSPVRHGLFTTRNRGGRDRDDGRDVLYKATVTAERPNVAPIHVLSLALQRNLAEVELLARPCKRGRRAPSTSCWLVHRPPLQRCTTAASRAARRSVALRDRRRST